MAAAELLDEARRLPAAEIAEDMPLGDNALSPRSMRDLVRPAVIAAACCARRAL